MLFNSFIFIGAFLPIFLALYFFAAQRNGRYGIVVIVAASLIFYSWWYPPSLSILAVSILWNFSAAILLTKSDRRSLHSNWVFYIAVIGNLLFLAYYKYLGFLFTTFNHSFGAQLHAPEIVIPLGISFFTFHQLFFLAGIRSGEVKLPDFLHYVGYVTFFPQLIAGPITKYQEIGPQFERNQANPPRPSRRLYGDLALGLTIFAIGLAKKVLLADTMATFSDPVFHHVAKGGEVTFFESWIAAFSFSFQLYFDFSGYSDMAVGLARMVGYRLPVNFLSPYLATNIRDFWQFWHITMTRFFMEQLYTPIALWATRKAMDARLHGVIAFGLQTVLPILLSFLLIGLWHGPAWHFVVFGAMHALYLTIYHGWKALQKAGIVPRAHIPTPYGSLLGIAVTFVAVTLSFVMFRAPSVGAALDLYRLMFAVDGLMLPAGIQAKIGDLAPVLSGLGVKFGDSIFWQGTRHFVWLVVAACIVFTLPNVYEIARRYFPAYTGRKRADMRRCDSVARYRRLSMQIRRVGVGVALAVTVLCWLLVFFHELPEFNAFIPPWVTLLLAVTALGVSFVLPARQANVLWRPDNLWAAAISLLLLASLIMLFTGNGEAFIYFEF